jgi:hypothetical protein
VSSARALPAVRAVPALRALPAARALRALTRGSRARRRREPRVRSR